MVDFYRAALYMLSAVYAVVVCLKLFRVDGKAERTANDSIFVGHVIRETIGVRGCRKQGTQPT